MARLARFDLQQNSKLALHVVSYHHVVFVPDVEKVTSSQPQIIDKLHGSACVWGARVAMGSSASKSTIFVAGQSCNFLGMEHRYWHRFLLVVSSSPRSSKVATEIYEL